MSKTANGAARAKTVYIPGEDTYNWRMYSVNQRNMLLAVPKTASGKWTQAAVRKRYFPGLSANDAARRIRDKHAEWDASGKERNRYAFASTKADKAKYRRANERYVKLYEELSQLEEAYGFGFGEIRHYKQPKEEPQRYAPAYYRAPTPAKARRKR